MRLLAMAAVSAGLALASGAQAQTWKILGPASPRGAVVPSPIVESPDASIFPPISNVPTLPGPFQPRLPSNVYTRNTRLAAGNYTTQGTGVLGHGVIIYDDICVQGILPTGGLTYLRIDRVSTQYVLFSTTLGANAKLWASTLRTLPTPVVPAGNGPIDTNYDVGFQPGAAPATLVGTHVLPAPGGFFVADDYGVDGGSELITIPLNLSYLNGTSATISGVPGTIGSFVLGIQYTDLPDASTNYGLPVSDGPSAVPDTAAGAYNAARFWKYDEDAVNPEVGAFGFGTIPSSFCFQVHGELVAGPAPVPCCISTNNSPAICMIVGSSDQCTLSRGTVVGAVNSACVGATPCAATVCCNPATGECKVQIGNTNCGLWSNGVATATTCSAAATTACAAFQMPAPPNDACGALSGAFDLISDAPDLTNQTGAYCTSTVVGATVAVCNYFVGADVYYKWTPAAAGVLYSIVATDNPTSGLYSTEQLVLSLYDHCPLEGSADVATVTCFQDTINTHILNFTSVDNTTTYYIRIQPRNGGTSTFSIGVHSANFVACCGVSNPNDCVLSSFSGVCDANHVAQGAGTTCTPIACPGFACCNNTTSACNFRTVCNPGETATGAQSTSNTCNPVPCTGIPCCNPTTGACTFWATEAVCNSNGGVLGIGASSCAPSPCRVQCCNAITGQCGVSSGYPNFVCPPGYTAGLLGVTCSPNICNPAPIPHNDDCFSVLGSSDPLDNIPALVNGFASTGYQVTAGGDVVGTLWGAQGDNIASACSYVFVSTAPTLFPGSGVYYKFTPTAGASYCLSLCTSTQQPDTTLAIFTDCGTPSVLCDDDGCTPVTGLSTIASYTPATATPVLVRVGMWRSDETPGQFLLNVIQLGVCCNPTTGGCRAIAAAATAGCTGNEIFNDTVLTCGLNNAPCPQVAGACCSATGVCSSVDPTTCINNGGTVVGGTCDPLTTCPHRACCANGVCSFTILNDCNNTANGVWGAAGSSCTPNACPQFACCLSGTCTASVDGACTGGSSPAVPAASGACTPQPCPQPLGACCSGAGTCTQTTGDACPGSTVGSFGVPSANFFQGVGTACTATNCGVCCRGATCVTNALTSAACTSSLPGGSGAGASYVSNTACGGANHKVPCCYADYNKIGGKTVADIFSYLTDWFAHGAFAWNGTPGPGGAGNPPVSQIFAFLSDWFAGC